MVPLSVDMWNQRINAPAHSTTTKEYGQPGPPVFFSECVCGWRSHLQPRDVSMAEAARHVAHPEQMRDDPYWT
jgi:hypothetical protein